MSAFDGCVIFQLTLRRMARLALVIVGLRQTQVIFTGGKVHIIVARAACRAGGVGHVISGLRRAAILLMTRLTATDTAVDYRRAGNAIRTNVAAWVRGENDIRPIAH